MKKSSFLFQGSGSFVELKEVHSFTYILFADYY